ncbi:alanine-zipper protein [Roseofilum casamattae]|uniref:Rpn family recombination-promoting nuclease/putative transposase n=1 Tax=Roseofilum casamattae BLCC-M143 TaxID=3022442 RepID=A0ABT7BUJ3_9CYAN|nr:alanine-zipper protein [Roseofilum casamattae]MDJ1182861.1 hypothetical protein [Roseofilum casamattae BLCC-M143]
MLQLEEYHGVKRQWLRWYDARGHWIPTPAERAQEEANLANQRARGAREEANLANQRAQSAEQSQKRAIPRLLSMGLSAEQVAEALGLSVEEISQWTES